MYNKHLPVRSVVSLIASLFLVVLSQAQTPELALDSFIMAQAERSHVPGVVVGVVEGDQLLWAKGYGWADIEKKHPMSPEGIMNIGSVSKTITATAVMQLWERGKLGLDTDVNTYLPFKVYNPNHPERRITVRQLLTHTSSINDGPSYSEGYQCGDPLVSLEDWITGYFSTEGKWYDPVANFHKDEPDSLYEYSNTAFGLLGYIVEQVSGMPFTDFVQESIFDPLEMESSGYYYSDIDTNRIITPYLYLGPLQKNLVSQEGLPLKYYNPYCRYSFWNYPDGLVRTSVEDLSHFAIAYINGGKYKDFQLLQASTIDMMHQTQLSEEVEEAGAQGLSWFHSTGLAPSWYHSGADPGISTRFYVDKENKLSVIVFQNASANNTFTIVRELYQYFIGE